MNQILEFLLVDSQLLMEFLEYQDLFRLVAINFKLYQLFHGANMMEKLLLSKLYYSNAKDTLSFKVKSKYFSYLPERFPNVDHLNVLYHSHSLHLQSNLCKKMNSWIYGLRNEPASIMIYRSNESILSCVENIRYMEIQFKESFSENSCFSVGFTTINDFNIVFEQNWMLGWSKDSIGYHSDDGLICREGCAQVHKKEKFTHRDTIGFGIQTKKNVVFFTKNGKLIYHCAFSFFWNITLYPAIVMDDFFSYQINHGEEKFQFQEFVTI